jgi:hypothetical protein
MDDRGVRGKFDWDVCCSDLLRGIDLSLVEGVLLGVSALAEPSFAFAFAFREARVIGDVISGTTVVSEAFPMLSPSSELTLPVIS